MWNGPNVEITHTFKDLYPHSFDKWTPYVCEAFFTKEVVADEDAGDNINDNHCQRPRFSTYKRERFPFFQDIRSLSDQLINQNRLYAHCTYLLLLTFQTMNEIRYQRTDSWWKNEHKYICRHLSSFMLNFLVVVEETTKRIPMMRKSSNETYPCNRK